MKVLSVLLLLGLMAYLVYDKMSQPTPKAEKASVGQKQAGVTASASKTEQVPKFDKRAHISSLRETIIKYKDCKVIPPEESFRDFKNGFEKISPDEHCTNVLNEMMKISMAVSNPSSKNEAPEECFGTIKGTCEECSGRRYVQANGSDVETRCTKCGGKGMVTTKSFTKSKAVTAFSSRCEILITYLDDQLNNL